MAFRLVEESIPVSGSAQFSAIGLKNILQEIPCKNLIVVDLRKESHGFIDEKGVSWFGEKNWANIFLTPEEVERDQEIKLQELTGRKTTCIYPNKYAVEPITIPITKVYSEKFLTEQHNVNYLRLYILDHSKPDDRSVDSFVSLIKNLKKEEWVHIHCAAGRGRTTTFMALADMIYNSKTATCEQILIRQKERGGMDLLHPSEEAPWKDKLHSERLQFLKQFHSYCKESDLSTSWSCWQNLGLVDK